jgi:hypothetical protein
MLSEAKHLIDNVVTLHFIQGDSLLFRQPLFLLVYYEDFQRSLLIHLWQGTPGRVKI